MKNNNYFLLLILLILIISLDFRMHQLQVAVSLAEELEAISKMMRMMIFIVK
jgi:hypothetical protein